MLTDKFANQASSEATWDDYLDFKVTIIDNGDEKVTIQIYNGHFKTLDI